MVPSLQYRVPYVDRVNSFEYFSVAWTKDPLTLEPIFPALNNSCGNGACTVTPDKSCLCSVTVSENPAFSSLPSREQALQLHVGAFHPDTFANSTTSYSLLQASDAIEVYVSSDSGVIGDTSTIFKVIDSFGNIKFIKNLNSTIKLGNKYELRNPPSFMNPVRVELRDAENEGMYPFSTLVSVFCHLILMCNYVILYTLLQLTNS